jgi:hypothetical protein
VLSGPILLGNGGESNRDPPPAAMVRLA